MAAAAPASLQHHLPNPALPDPYPASASLAAKSTATALAANTASASHAGSARLQPHSVSCPTSSSLTPDAAATNPAAYPGATCSGSPKLHNLPPAAKSQLLYTPLSPGTMPQSCPVPPSQALALTAAAPQSLSAHRHPSAVCIWETASKTLPPATTCGEHHSLLAHVPQPAADEDVSAVKTACQAPVATPETASAPQSASLAHKPSALMSQLLSLVACPPSTSDVELASQATQPNPAAASQIPNAVPSSSMRSIPMAANLSVLPVQPLHAGQQHSLARAAMHEGHQPISVQPLLASSLIAPDDDKHTLPAAQTAFHSELSHSKPQTSSHWLARVSTVIQQEETPTRFTPACPIQTRVQMLENACSKLEASELLQSAADRPGRNCDLPAAPAADIHPFFAAAPQQLTAPSGPQHSVHACENRIMHAATYQQGLAGEHDSPANAFPPANAALCNMREDSNAQQTDADVAILATVVNGVQSTAAARDEEGIERCMPSCQPIPSTSSPATFAKVNEQSTSPLKQYIPVPVECHRDRQSEPCSPAASIAASDAHPGHSAIDLFSMVSEKGSQGNDSASDLPLMEPILHRPTKSLVQATVPSPSCHLHSHHKQNQAALDLQKVQTLPTAAAEPSLTAPLSPAASPPGMSCHSNAEQLFGSVTGEEAVRPCVGKLSADTERRVLVAEVLRDMLQAAPSVQCDADMVSC